MSRTRAALVANSVDSSSSRPKIFTSRAPETLNRSVIVWLIAALTCIDSRVIAASRLPTQRAGSTNSGSSASEMRVICHDSSSIVTSTSTSETTLETTDDRVDVNACWAPTTSLLRRETSEPVCVLVKNATGIRCTWSKTLVRRS